MYPTFHPQPFPLTFHPSPLTSTPTPLTSTPNPFRILEPLPFTPHLSPLDPHPSPPTSHLLPLNPKPSEPQPLILQGYLAYTKQPLPRTQHKDQALSRPYGGPMGGGQFLISEVTL